MLLDPSTEAQSNFTGDIIQKQCFFIYNDFLLYLFLICLRYVIRQEHLHTIQNYYRGKCNYCPVADSQFYFPKSLCKAFKWGHNKQQNKFSTQIKTVWNMKAKHSSRDDQSCKSPCRAIYRTLYSSKYHCLISLISI